MKWAPPRANERRIRAVLSGEAHTKYRDPSDRGESFQPISFRSDCREKDETGKSKSAGCRNSSDIHPTEQDPQICTLSGGRFEQVLTFESRLISACTDYQTQRMCRSTRRSGSSRKSNHKDMY